MPPSSSKQTPLPLAPNRAALANEISLLLSRRTALLKTLNPTSTSSSSTSRKRAAAPDADAVEQLFSGPRPNQGVGYVPERNNDGDAASARDQTLRRKLLGKNFKNGKSVVKGRGKGAESESDEEEGRSALGKRKRPRREEEVVRDDDGEREGESEKAGVTTDTVGELRTEEEEEEERREEGGHEEVEDEEPKHDAGDDAVPVKGTAAISDNAADEAKRDKKRKKRQREKQKQKQKREQK